LATESQGKGNSKRLIQRLREKGEENSLTFNLSPLVPTVFRENLLFLGKTAQPWSTPWLVVKNFYLTHSLI
jgi:hypothetical protein